MNKGEPSSKLKYELMTDSVKYCEGKVKRTQLKLTVESEIEILKLLALKAVGAYIIY